MKNETLAVILAPFQIPTLEGDILQAVQGIARLHETVVFMLPVKRMSTSAVSPLDFHTRQLMIQEAFPKAMVLPFADQKYPKDRVKVLESTVNQLFIPGRKTYLFTHLVFRNIYVDNGGRWEHRLISADWDILEKEEHQRNSVLTSPRQSVDFRAGAIYAANRQYPTSFATVDIAVTRMFEGRKQVLLGRKHGELKFRFPGGYKDRKDDGYEVAGKRESREETKTDKLTPLKYLGSRNVNDWRYDGEEDCITTVLFSTEIIGNSGQIEAGDDIVETGWFDVSTITPEQMEGEHSHLLRMFLESECETHDLRGRKAVQTKG